MIGKLLKHYWELMEQQRVIWWLVLNLFWCFKMQLNISISKIKRYVEDCFITLVVLIIKALKPQFKDFFTSKFLSLDVDNGKIVSRSWLVHRKNTFLFRQSLLSPKRFSGVYIQSMGSYVRDMRSDYVRKRSRVLKKLPKKKSFNTHTDMKPFHLASVGNLENEINFRLA